MSRLTIDITDQQHQTLKAMAALQGKSIKQYAVERLFPNIDPNTDKEEQAMIALRELLTARVAEASRGEVSTKSISEIAEEAIQNGGVAIVTGKQIGRAHV